MVRSKEYVDALVWVRARDHLRVLEEPSLCTTLLWPTREGEGEGLDISLPAYLLRERQGEAMGGWGALVAQSTTFVVARQCDLDIGPYGNKVCL